MAGRQEECCICSTQYDIYNHTDILLSTHVQYIRYRISKSPSRHQFAKLSIMSHFIKFIDTAMLKCNPKTSTGF